MAACENRSFFRDTVGSSHLRASTTIERLEDLAACLDLLSR